MLKKSIISIALMLFAISGFSQASYDKAIGLRGGLSNGITYKQFLSEQNAFEAIVYSRWRGFQFTALYEIHNSTTFSELGLVWYYGFGGHVGFYDGRYNRRWFDDNRTHTTLGVDAIIGIEYTFDEVPINLSLDYKPSFVLFGYNGFWGGDAAVSIRYTF